MGLGGMGKKRRMGEGNRFKTVPLRMKENNAHAKVPKKIRMMNHIKMPAGRRVQSSRRRARHV